MPTAFMLPETRIVFEGKLLTAGVPIASVPGETFDTKLDLICDMEAKEFIPMCQANVFFVILEKGMMLSVPPNYLILSQVLGPDAVHGMRWSTAKYFPRRMLEQARDNFFRYCDEFPESCKEGTVSHKMRFGNSYKNLISSVSAE